MISAEILDLVTSVMASATTSPAVVESGAMQPKDWWTIAVGIVAGLGGALVAGLAQAWKAKHDVRLARDSALWEYHRVLTDISADISGFMGDTVEGYDDGRFRDRIKEARKAAYPYFYLFPKADRIRLTYPTSNDRYQSEPHEDQAQIDAAITALENFLLPKRRKTRPKSK